jgi:Uncharacterized protein conserved in bacteria
MSGLDWRAFDAELRARVPELAVALLGEPTFRTGQEWRWGRKGSLSVVVAGVRAGMWFDHEEGRGGWFSDLVGRDLGVARDHARDWIAGRIGMGDHLDRARPLPDRHDRPAPREPAAPPHDDGLGRCVEIAAAAPAITSRAEEAAARAARIWAAAQPAPADHPYLAAKQVAPLALRIDARGHLAAPLHDVDGRLHSLEFIAPDCAKRYLAGGAKRGRFSVIDAEPAPDRRARPPAARLRGLGDRREP